MASKAYFMVEVVEKFCPHGYRDILRDLEAIPEVQSVERVSGPCELLVKVEAPVRTIFVANKLMAKEWVKNLRILHVEPIRAEDYQGLNIDELIRLKRFSPVETA